MLPSLLVHPALRQRVVHIILSRRSRTRRMSCRASLSGGSAAIVWFRNDLRLTDHEPLHTALASQPAALLPLFCLDELELQPRALAAADGSTPAELQLGVPRLGPFRLRAVLEALSALNDQLLGLGSRLAFHQGRPDKVLGRVASLLLAGGGAAAGGEGPGGSGFTAVQQPQYDELALHYYLSADDGAAEVEAAVEAAVRAAAAQHGVSCSIHRHWGHSLYHPDDLPYNFFQQQRSGKKGAASAGRGAAAQAAAEQAAAEPLERRSVLDPQRFACLPGVMSDFRRAVQAQVPVRQPLPPPSSLPPLPRLPPDAAEQGLFGTGVPTSLAAVYEAAGAGPAVERLESLLGQSVASIPWPSPGTGPVDPRSAFPFAVGEPQGLQRLRFYLGQAASDGVSQRGAGEPLPMAGYQDSRMRAYGVDTSAKLSPFLALGCLSPRTVFWEAAAALEEEEAGVQQLHGTAEAAAAAAAAGAGAGGKQQGRAVAADAEQQGQHPQQQGLEWREPVRGDGVRWLLMHLGIRDFFIFMALKEGAGLLQPGGIRGADPAWRADPAAFKRWACGQSGLPFVDACMREIATTGFMSNRGRQNVANFVAKGLGLDWCLGLALFECLLIDHDWALNLGNWAYNAGTGHDPRNRQFRTVSQGEAYCGPEADFIRTWVPELASLPTPLVHRPWEREQGWAAGQAVADAGGSGAGAAEGLGEGYPAPMVDPATQIRLDTGRGSRKGNK